MTQDARLRKVWSDPRILAWWAFLLLVSPVLLLAKLRKYIVRPRPWEFDPARWRVDDLTPELADRLRSQSGPHIVFIGGGFGEMMMVDRIAGALRKTRPDVRITFCLRDPNTVAFLRDQRPEQNLAVWPFDALPPVARWLGRQKPDVVVFTERFRFVTILTAAARYGARVALMNGRCRYREGLAYTVSAPFYRWQFHAFSAMGMQREDYYEAAHKFARTDCDIRLTGDIKTDLKEPSLDQERLASLESWLPKDGVPLIAAGSTENVDEDVMVLEAFRLVRQRVACRLLLAPRRPWLVQGLIEYLDKAGYDFSRRSENSRPADIMLLDTLGELSTAYGHCQAAYVGGAFIQGHGGHNVMEPLFWGVPVAYGMQRGHFEQLQRLCEDHGVSTRIRNAPELAEFFLKFIQDPEERKRIGDEGQRVIEAGRGAVQRTVEMLNDLMSD